MKEITILIISIFLIINIQAQIPIFPGAEGGGMYATGGRYCKNIIVDHCSFRRIVDETAKGLNSDS
jgi:hypothetical protein